MQQDLEISVMLLHAEVAWHLPEGNDFHKDLLSFNLFLFDTYKLGKAAGPKPDLCIDNVSSKIHNKWKSFTNKQASKQKSRPD